MPRPNPIARFTRNLPPGQLCWIGLRAARRAPVTVVSEAAAQAGRGLVGDHRADKTPGSGRQITLISREFIDQAAHYLGRDSIDPALLRRNLVIAGVNLHLLRHQPFRIGDVRLQAGALCHPCSRMEEALGSGGVAAMYGHGGLCCRVLNDGILRVGDAVTVVTDPVDDLFD